MIHQEKRLGPNGSNRFFVDTASLVTLLLLADFQLSVETGFLPNQPL
jgi:hypothetical protein